MSIQVTGVIEHKDIGIGTWALVADSGVTYEIMDTPDELQKPNLKVQVTGEVRDDVMTLATIGPVLALNSFKVLD
ncbi:MAG TPA: hypothetical protein DEG17_04140 [Cyanobacteria bacterium UBA11149]|nr:hypothetical protein [Cyanobacteria bacterium UBA11367]HBE59562.1 hypothetical protein [Cyanobacteria bacterium UBA11366]HBK65370.1 hypothetical protein [Cyanobacteria bacterium UBA11166]HBR75058.1 hypothetical protein [Cyanobacteria bacterium UBA11159]HBS68046.1 hypothetical protein [Cyanobacteria bacterium UBA11153]HBW88081.1 hypothetical protein [Cyanobacteria bacterium UBA11149]HCA95266.1 hypothetical protein [Cyanobacteria bacterium UBA9226]